MGRWVVRWAAMWATAAGVCAGCEGGASPSGGDGSDASGAAADAPLSDVAAADTPAADTPAADTAAADEGGEPSLSYARCPRAEASGRISVILGAVATSVQGYVADGVVPTQVSDVASTDGECELLVPPNPFCEQACLPGDTCGLEGSCVPYPANQDVGALRLSGLASPVESVEVEAIPPQNFYYYTGSLPHPGVLAGAEVALEAGAEDEPTFRLRGRGVSPLVVLQDEVALVAASPASVAWAPAASDPGVRVHLLVNLANHGGVPARIECVTADDGSFEIPASLVEELLAIGYSGFPTVAITRESLDAAATDLGCVEFQVQSSVVVPAAIAGLVSCSSSEDCPSEQTCRLDLTCQ